ncbi:MAG: iron complex transport system substrate-binding protein [Flavobacteriales bacterium]|jgi:iron complex transport system substrate-binding protein
MKRILPILICITLLYSCKEETVSDTTEEKSVIANGYAKGFEISRLASGGLEIRLLNLETEQRETLRTLVVSTDSSEAQAADTYFAQPVSELACLSTTHIAMIDIVGAIETVQGTAFAEYVRNTNAVALIETGEIVTLSGSEEIEFELLLDLNPELFLVYPYGQTDYTLYENNGIPCIPVSEYLEEHPLGRAEWIKVIGALTGHFNESLEEFDRIEQEYIQLTQMVQDIPPDARPSIFTGSHSNGQWFAPPGNSFIGQFIRDAGGTYLFEDYIQTGNVELQFEELFDLAYDVDYWGKVVFEEGELTLESIRANDPRYAELNAFKSGQVMYCNASETDYFGDAIVEPQAILADLIAILHPKLLPDYTFHYFQQVNK